MDLSCPLRVSCLAHWCSYLAGGVRPPDTPLTLFHPHSVVNQAILREQQNQRARKEEEGKKRNVARPSHRFLTYFTTLLFLSWWGHFVPSLWPGVQLLPTGRSPYRAQSLFIFTTLKREKERKEILCGHLPWSPHLMYVYCFWVSCGRMVSVLRLGKIPEHDGKELGERETIVGPHIFAGWL